MFSTEQPLFRLGIGFLAISLVGGEVVARFVLGLGDPPLSVAHPTIEYLLKPNQVVHRFGNRYLVNQYGMQSEPLPKHHLLDKDDSTLEASD